MRVADYFRCAVFPLLLASSPARGQEPVLTPPVLVRNVSPRYPEGARQAGRTAVVVVTLEIDAEGKVRAATVKEPAGMGFDEAAVEAASQLQFTPAMRDLRPVPSRILYKMTFTLQPTESTASAEGTQPPSRSRLKIQVRLVGADTPYAGATIRLRLADGRTEVVTTDERGEQSVDNLPIGAVTVQAQAPGFAVVETTEQLNGGEEVGLVLRLRPEGGALQVQVRGERPDREITRRSINREELAIIPGTGGDALRAVQSMPSVARSPAITGLLMVRGTAPNGTSVFVDGTWVPNVYHFMGMSSVIPTEMLERLDFYPGNFSARYGRVMGGIVDVKTREISADGKYHGLAQVDWIDARLMLQGPVPWLKGWSFVVGGRRSHLDTWLPKAMPDDVSFRAAPVYYDYQGFVETRPTSKSLLRIGVFGSDDRVAMSMGSSPDPNDPGLGSSLGFYTRFWRAQASYRNVISDNVSMGMSLSYGRDASNWQMGSIVLDQRQQALSARGELAYKARPNLTFRIGPDVLYFPYDVDIRAPQPPRAGEPDPGPFSGQRLMLLKQSKAFSLPAAFAEAEWLPHDRMKVLAGLRGDYFNLTDRLDVSPRLNVRYDLTRAPVRTTVKAGAGLFYQRPEGEEVAPPFGTPGLVSNRAVHYSLGVEQQLSENVDVSVEGFYKDLDDQVVRVAERDGSQGYKNIGTGSVFGTETLIRYKPDGRFFGWIAHTMSRSTRKDAPEKPEHVFEYDQTHIFTALGSYLLGRGWTVGGKFRLVTGNPYTACHGGVLNAAVGSYACRTGPIFAERSPAFHQLDIRVDKKWQFRDWSLTTYLDLLNVYNRKNAEGVTYNYNYTRSFQAYGIPILPSFGVRGEF